MVAHALPPSKWQSGQVDAATWWTQRRGGRSDVAALESLKDFSATPMRLCDRVDPPFRCVAWAYTHPGLTVPTPYYLLL